MDRDNPAYRGQSEYTPFFLKLYDPVILRFMTRGVALPDGSFGGAIPAAHPSSPPGRG